MSLYTAPEWARSALVTIDTQRDTLDSIMADRESGTLLAE